MDINSIIRSIIIAAPGVIIAITLHEAAHGYVASRFGDDTARYMGRLTLNPIKHIDPFGTILLPIILFIATSGRLPVGYAKPVPINPYNLRNPKKDMIFVSAAGPVTNVIIAIAAVILLDMVWAIHGLFPPLIITKVFDPVIKMIVTAIYINAVLAAFNLIPIVPLDGGRILSGLLPRDLEEKYSRIEPYGFFIVLGLLYFGIARYFVFPIVLIIVSIVNLLNFTAIQLI